MCDITLFPLRPAHFKPVRTNNRSLSCEMIKTEKCCGYEEPYVSKAETFPHGKFVILNNGSQLLGLFWTWCLNWFLYIIILYFLFPSSFWRTKCSFLMVILKKSVLLLKPVDALFSCRNVRLFSCVFQIRWHLHQGGSGDFYFCTFPARRLYLPTQHGSICFGCTRLLLGFLLRLWLHSKLVTVSMFIFKCGDHVVLEVTLVSSLLLWTAWWAQVTVFPLRRRKRSSCHSHCRCETPKTINQWVPFVCKPKRRNKRCLILFLIKMFDFSCLRSLSSSRPSLRLGRGMTAWLTVKQMHH